MDMVIDAGNCIAGRLASWLASELLKGKRIAVVNAEQAVVSGKPDTIFRLMDEKVKKGDPYHGPFYPRYPDRVLKRMVRGMLPYKKPRGREALKRLRVYISIPDELKERETTRVKDAENRLSCRFVSLGELGRKLGAKVEKKRSDLDSGSKSK